VAGALLRTIRVRLGLRQEQMAEALGADLNTYRSWENGRRPLSRISVQRHRSLLRALRRLGANDKLVDLIDTAIDVDLSISQIICDGPAPSEHPLAHFVQTKTWHDLLAWAVAGITPKVLINGGSEAPAPRLPVPDRSLLLDNLRVSAERTGARTDAVATLLRRQVYFVVSWDDSGQGRDWLSRMERQELARMRPSDGWTPTWVASRSLAVAKSVSGDPEQLRHFIAHQLVTDGQEIANLNYWANWSGEDDRVAVSDDFMRAPDLGAWRGTTLLRHLADGLKPSTAYVELTVHTVWALLERRPWLLDDEPPLTARLRQHAEELLDNHKVLSSRARRELEQIFFATRMRRSH
jgi:transcriptional regulator with XRE-family HTH domain